MFKFRVFYLLVLCGYEQYETKIIGHLTTTNMEKKKSVNQIKHFLINVNFESLS